MRTQSASRRIVTLTANPSLDRTLTLPGPLERGSVVRLAPSSTEPGGKGVNVARALAAAGGDVVTVLPAADDDPIVGALQRLGLPMATVPVAAAVRTNYTLAEPDGTTTKLNEPGAPLDAATRDALTAALHRHAEGARWVVLSGSLPPATPVDWYADLVRSLRDTGARIAVDTSEAPLLALLGAGPDASPDLLKPNSEELAQLSGVPEGELTADRDAALAAVATLHERGVAEVLLTLGGDGALLSCAEGVWVAVPPRIAVRSTVGAGDCSLAGHLLADSVGAAPAERLRSAVAYGAASASLPGSSVPTPDQVADMTVEVTAVGTPVPSTAAPGTTAPGTTPSTTAPGTSVPAAGRDVR